MSKTLLLADDSVTIQKVVGISFASEDITISTVDNGDDAISKARELRPDVILADVVMPGKSGYEVCEAIKADASLAHIPVLLLTGTFEAFDEERATAAGASGHVAKPFEAQTLVERVKELLAQSPLPAAPVPEPEPAPEPASTIVQEVPAMPAAAAASPDNSFDFFDDHAEPAALDAADSAAAGASLDFDGPDAAFAFGDDDLGATDPNDRTGPNDSRAASVPPPEATVAILPEDVPPPDLTPPPPPAAGDDFDFAFETVKPKADGDLISGEDLAQAAVLDPDAGADFDVSSSDLGPGAPAPEMPSHDVIPPPVPQVPESADSVISEFAAEPVSDPVMDLLSNSAPPANPEPIAEPEAFAPSPGDTLDAAPAPEPAWDPIASAEPIATDEPIATAEPLDSDPMDDEPMEVTPIGDALSEAPIDDGRWESAPEADLEPEPALVVPVAPTTASPIAASDLIERIEPALRGQIHETLEKIAWESFGQATESIVAKAIERIEQAAWEVVPKLAETLIQEEIRKLKGDSEDI